MRILYFVLHEPWPLTTGARLRDYHLARELASRAAVTYVGFRNAGDPEPAPPPAESNFERTLVFPKDRSFGPVKLLRGLLGPTPVTVLNFVSAEISRRLAVLLEEGKFDTVQLEGVQLGPYVPAIRSAASRPAVICDWHNLDSEVMWRYADRSSPGRRMVARRTAALLEGAERKLLSECDCCTLASQREREQAIEKWQPATPLEVIPNGVESAFYGDAQIAAARSRSTLGADSGERHLLYVGSMDYHANVDAVVWFVSEAWPEVRRRYPGIKFFIVGREPTPEVRALAGNGIVVTGTVDDVRPYYAGAAAVVVPLKIGSGTRLKILEAMAAGIPVVSTRLGAEGLDVTDKKDILLADTTEEMLQSIDRLQSEPELGHSLASNGRKLISSRYDWTILGEALHRIHAETLDRVRSRK
jgi:polysaccharide biosynthesis protein PslH